MQRTETTTSSDDVRAATLLRDRRLYIIFAVTLIAVLGVSSVTPAFPRVIRHFGIAPAQVGLLITLFTLPGVLLNLPFGVLADRFGRKRVLVPSLFVFGLAGAGCGLAPDFRVLVALRLVQGIGAAGLSSLNLTLIGDLFDGRQRAAVMGLNASVLSVGTASYPALGGALALAGWRYPFLLPLLAVPVGLWLTWSFEPPPLANGEPFRSYVRNAAHQLADRRVIGLLFASTSIFVVLYGALLTYYPLLIHDELGGDSLAIGLVLTSSSVASAAVSSQLARIAARLRGRTIVLLGFGLVAAAMAAVPFIPSVVALVLPTLAFGAALGATLPTIMNWLAGIAPLAYRASLMALNGTVLRLGQTLGPVVAGAAFAAWGFDGVFWTGATVAAASLPVLALLLRGD